MCWRMFVTLVAVGTAMLSSDRAKASSSTFPDPSALLPIVESVPTLAPFQHVRFCLRYPVECKPSLNQRTAIELDQETIRLLDNVNRDVNLSIAPKVKAYAEVSDGWSIAPEAGDCNDYAVTKRHNLIEGGLPSGALRLAVIKTSSGIGHLVLIVATTGGDVVLDNLTSAIRPWQATTYQWLKIQSANDPRFWSEVKPSDWGTASARTTGLHLARR
jgi:predicted transglutaminase-like cysteine proteinase